MSVWMSQEHKFLPQTCDIFKPHMDLDFSCITLALAMQMHWLITHHLLFFSLFCELFYSAIAIKAVTF